MRLKKKSTESDQASVSESPTQKGEELASPNAEESKEIASSVEVTEKSAQEESKSSEAVPVIEEKVEVEGEKIQSVQID